MKSKFYVYESPVGGWITSCFVLVNLRSIYFCDRDDVYDFLEELITLRIIPSYPRSVWLQVHKKDECRMMTFSKSNVFYAISNREIPFCYGKLIASPGGDEHEVIATETGKEIPTKQGEENEIY